MEQNQLATEIPALVPAGKRPGLRWLSSPIIPIAIFILTVLVFLRSIPCDFVQWDDDIEIYGNPHIRELTWSSLVWMFSDITLVRRYIPLDWLSWAINFKLALWLTGDGLTPWTYHLGNVLIHATNAVLVYEVLRRVLDCALGGGAAKGRALAWCSAFGALLWALHPLRVEAVTWANSRIHEQALLFGLASLVCYLRRHDEGRSRFAERAWFIGAVGLYVLSLLSYGTTLAYVIVLLVVDVLVLHRLDVDGRVRWRSEQARRVLKEKIPILAAAAVYLGITLWAAYTTVIRIKPPTLAEFGVTARIMQSFYIWGRYLWKPFDPFHLAPVYAVLVQFNPWGWLFVGSMALVVGITVGLVMLRRQSPGLLGLWICHLALLVPVLGLTEHPHYPSDRYSYVEGILWSIAAGVLLMKLMRSSRAGIRVAGAGTAVALLIFCAALSVWQQGFWKDSETMFLHDLAEIQFPPTRADIYGRLGDYYYKQGRYREAIEKFDMTLAIVPGRMYTNVKLLKAIALTRLGDESAAEGQGTEAVTDYLDSASMLLPIADEDPTPMTLDMLGVVYTKANRLVEAEKVFRESMRRFPAVGLTALRLAQVRYLRGDVSEARALVQRSIELNPSLESSAKRVAAYWQSLASSKPGPATTQK